ncbi:MAG TPA: four helix bundle protein [Patescibacteria group bacterium]|nr:four helix bundle protein [Patescibacteria group bacterium]
MRIESYENLIVWQKAMDLVIAVYEVTRKFPHEEIYGSGAELETHIKIARRLSYGGSKDYIQVEMLIGEVMRILNKFTHEFSK